MIFLSSGTLTKTEDNPSNVFATLNPLDTADQLYQMVILLKVNNANGIMVLH